VEPIIVRPNAWPCAYVVIDGLRGGGYAGKGVPTPFKGEVYDLIAALVKGKPESAMDDGLKRLRWMFLGYRPDFIPETDPDGNGTTLELLDPAKIDRNDVLAIFDRLAETYLPYDPIPPIFLRATATTGIQLADRKTVADRLASLQDYLNLFAVDLLKGTDM
jgi:hypothetical protein